MKYIYIFFIKQIYKNINIFKTKLKDFAIGQLLKKSSFTLYETMSAIEVNSLPSYEFNNNLIIYISIYIYYFNIMI